MNAMRNGRSIIGWLLVVVAVVLIVQSLHVKASVASSKTWTIAATNTLSIETPCAHDVDIAPTEAAGAKFVITAQAGRAADIDGLQTAAGGAGETVISNSSACPSEPTMKLTIDAPSGTGLKIDEAGTTDYRVEPGAGPLTLLSSGSGDVSTGSVTALNATLSGSGDASIGSIVGDVSATLSGSGDLSIGSLQATHTALSLTGSGDVSIGGGEAGVLTARLDASGDLNAGGGASQATLLLDGDGDVSIDQVTGDLNATLSDDGDLNVGRVGGDAKLALSGAGDVVIPVLTGHLTQSNSGSGDVDIGQH